jgi:putative spermidine/putrescine transport system substrate-binding protein
MKKKGKDQKGKGRPLFGQNMDRREFLKKGTQLGIAASAVGTGMLFKVPPARAAKSLQGSGEVIVCGWGGEFQDAMRETVFAPFTKETGIKVIDTATPSSAKVMAQVDSGNLEWDAALLSYLSGALLGTKYLETIDYSYFEDTDYKNIPEEVRRPLSCGCYLFSYVIAYNEKKFPPGGHPKTWADFVDFKRFPGKRAFASPLSGGHVHVESSQLGMGVPRDKLFPPDLKKVWAFYDKLKPNMAKWWTQGAEAPQMLSDGEIDVGMAYSARIQVLIDKGAPIKMEWNEGELAENSWCVMKGAKNVTNAMKLLAFASRAQVQAALADKFPNGPANLEAAKYVKPETRPKLNTAPENFKKQIMINWDWYIAKNLDPSGQKQNRQTLMDEWQSWVLK